MHTLTKDEWDSLLHLFRNTGHRLRLINGIDSTPTPLKRAKQTGLGAVARIVALHLNNIFSIWMDQAAAGRLEIQAKKGILESIAPWREWESLFRSLGLYVHTTHLQEGADYALCCVTPRQQFVTPIPRNPVDPVEPVEPVEPVASETEEAPAQIPQ